MKYIIYARKSTESEDRQSLSIASQIIEMQEIAKRDGLRVVKIFQEAKSAKAPGRPVFAEMLSFVEKGKAQGILCWKIDRLARNPLDEGKIKWMLQNGTIAQIKTFDREYNPDDNVVIASIEFSMANQYIRDLSKNVKRGLAEKVRRGEYPATPPLGYVNNPKTKKMVIEKKEAKIVRKMFDLCAHEKLSCKRIADVLEKEGFVGRNKKKIHHSLAYRTLTNPVYIGLFRWKDALHKGIHTSIVSKTLFDEAERKLFPGKFLKRRDKKIFAFRGLAICGECGLKITAEVKKGHTYYRCTKSKGTHNCSQKYLREEDLIERIGEELFKIQFDEEVLDLIVSASKEKFQKMQKERFSREEKLKKKLGELDTKENSLVEKFIENAIPKNIYDKHASHIVEERASVEEDLKNVSQLNADMIKGIETIARFAVSAHDIFANGDMRVKKEIAELVSSNFSLKDRKIAHFNLNEPFCWLVDDANILGVKIGIFEPSISPAQKGKSDALGATQSGMLGKRDSNPRMTGPKPVALPLGYSPVL